MPLPTLVDHVTGAGTGWNEVAIDLGCFRVLLPLKGRQSLGDAEISGMALTVLSGHETGDERVRTPEVPCSSLQNISHYSLSHCPVTTHKWRANPFTDQHSFYHIGRKTQACQRTRA